MTRQAQSLLSQKRYDEAIAAFRRTAEAYPQSAVTRHNLAAALGDARRYAESEREARRAIAMGLNAAQTRVVLARALQAQGEIDPAQQAFGEALDRDMEHLDAQFEWAQLVWMRTGDPNAALERIDQACARRPAAAGLKFIRARILEFTEGPVAGYAQFRAALDDHPDDVGLLVPAASLAVSAGRPECGVMHGRRAVALAPNHRGAQVGLAYALLGTGEAEQASAIAERLSAADPLDQHGLGLQAVAWRMLDDPRYRALYDYEAFVSVHKLDTPRGWADLSGYIADLAQALRRNHPFQTHPFGQSLRQGSQLADLLSIDDPAIQAFPEAIRGPVDAYLKAMGTGTDPLRSRNTGRWRIDGIWSAWLRPNGFHADHLHPRGWLSSACYIELPDATQGPGRQGWIKFGEPGLPTRPPLEAEHAVKPEVGSVVLFPSYMWHGTVPFQGDQPRLTVAFDIVPGGRPYKR